MGKFRRANAVRPYRDNSTIAIILWDVEDAVPYDVWQKIQLLMFPFDKNCLDHSSVLLFCASIVSSGNIRLPTELPSTAASSKLSILTLNIPDAPK